MCQHHLEDRHEGGRLAEVAAANYVGVDVEAVRVGPRLYAPCYVVQTSYNGWGELWREGWGREGSAIQVENDSSTSTDSAKPA